MDHEAKNIISFLIAMFIGFVLLGVIVLDEGVLLANRRNSDTDDHYRPRRRDNRSSFNHQSLNN